MAKNKKNTSKKIPKNVTGSQPYFLINSMGEIQEFALGGDLTKDEEEKEGGSDIAGALGALGGGGIGSTIGTTLSGAIGGDTNIAEDRTAGKDEAIMGGVLKGAGTGWDVGSKIGGPWGGVAGVVVGGVAGGFTAGDAKQTEISAFKDSMQKKYANAQPQTVQYYGAYGGELPTLALGGDPTDPPPATELGEIKVEAPRLIDNVNYDEQFKLYQQSLNNAPQASLSQWADQNMLDKFNADMQKNYPKRKGFNATKLKYDPTMVDANTGLPQQFLDYYDKPQKQMHAPMTAPTQPTTPKEYSYLNPHTGAPLDPEVYGRPEGNMDVQFSQGLELSSRKLETINKHQATQDEIAKNNELLTKMTPEQIAATKTAKMTPLEYAQVNNLTFADGGHLGQNLEMGGEATEFNGNTHEEGGLPIGNVEVEDGEIRVGDYVFSDRLTNAEGKTFAEAARKITKQYEEYQNDGPSMRTQDKMLKELKFENDQARLLKQKEEKEMEAAMQEDFMAYGGMIKKDSKGKYQVDKSNRMELMNAAKKRKMGYTKYIDSVYAYGGNLKEKLALGGPDDPYGLMSNLTGTGNYADQLGAGTSLLPVDNSIAVDNPITVDFSTPTLPESINVMGDQTGLITNPPDSPFAAATAFFQGQTPTLDNPNAGASADLTTSSQKQGFLDKIKKNFNEEEQALLASQLPNLSQLLLASKKGNTTFDRVNLDEVSLDNERRQVEASVDRARRVQRENVRGTASSAGDALAALSAGNAGLTQAEMDAKSSISERERNINTQVKNQESMTNVGISNQETIARQQDDAMRDSVRQLALSGMSDNYQGYIKDKKMAKENKASNKRLLSLLDTGEYEMYMEGNDIKIMYKDPNKED